MTSLPLDGASDTNDTPSKPQRLSPAAARAFLASLPLTDPDAPRGRVPTLSGEYSPLADSSPLDAFNPHDPFLRRRAAAVRSQADSLGDVASAATDVITERHPLDQEYGARQEFAESADLNQVLRKFGVPVPRVPEFGAVDYSLDLTRAHIAVAELHDAIDRLPADVVARYGGRRGTLTALQDGTFTLDEPDGSEQPVAPAPGTTPEPSPAPVPQ